ncbi:MAG: 2-phospho-L-lactate guanylyltransferase, partial [Anaerolineales bacterium]
SAGFLSQAEKVVAMKLWAIVPIKSIKQGKSRLSDALSDSERMELNYELVRKTLGTLNEVSQIERILVVSKDHEVLSLADEYGTMTVWEKGKKPNLNHALQQATSIAASYGAQAVLVLPTDLPLISSDEIRKLITYTGCPPEMIIAPDRKNEGTNALILNPHDIMKYEFGQNSFYSHISQAQRKGVRVSIYTSPALQLDLDLPEDLNLLQSSGLPLPFMRLCY